MASGTLTVVTPGGVRREVQHPHTPDEARGLLYSIDTSTDVGSRDRALIGLMVYSFARVGAALAMKVEDVFTQNWRLWVRLHEKRGKHHEMPCHHNLETYLHEYLDRTRIAGDPKSPLFERSAARGVDAGRGAFRQLPDPNRTLIP